MHIVIRLSGGSDISLESDDPQALTISDLRAKVRETRQGTTLNRQLRFFYNGHALNPRVDFAPESRGESDRVYVHCFMGRILSPEELQREAYGIQQPPPAPSQPEPRGFDRLLGMGFSDQDVQSLRQQFTDLYGATGDEAQVLEDIWIDNGDMSPYTSRVIDMLCIMTGVFAGIWALLLTRLNVFTRRQQSTVLFGVIINLVFSVVQYLT